jgi:hypothetical protein
MDPLLPEAIRGAWYLLPDEADPHTLEHKKAQQLFFELDGSFTRYKIKRGERRREHETGDYTFDGNFLITRGRSTDTYRVHPEGFWRWDLEEKKGDYVLLRGPFEADDFFTITPDQREELQRVPIRIAVQSPFVDDDERAIFELVHRPEDGEERPAGSLWADRVGSEILHIGLTPIVAGVDAALWERVVAESFLDVYLGEPDDIDIVELHLYDVDEVRRFEFPRRS